MYYAYVIINNKEQIYIGHTEDLNKRLLRHNGQLKSKRTSFTSRNRDGEWNLVCTEIYKTRPEAIMREKQLKSYQGRKFIRELIDKEKNK